MKIAPNSKLVMIGDSITDCGRALPVGEGLGPSLGNGYVSLVDALIRTAVPTAKLFAPTSSPFSTTFCTPSAWP